MRIPAVLARFATTDEPVEAVWLNGVGGVTYRLGTGTADRYLKWQPAHAEVSLKREERKLSWANPYTPSPRVIASGRSEQSTWLLTHALPGSSAVSSRWLARPEVAVRAVGRGLRELHDSLPVNKCPWQWDPSTCIDDATSRNIHVDPVLHDPPTVDQLVVCHGDACCPNTILTNDGELSGHVDFGSLGIADRWADIAVAAMSTQWNYGPGWEHELVSAYGLPVDHVRLDYYQQLWNAT